MLEELIVPLIGLLVIGLLLWFMVWCALMQRKGLTKQQEAIGSIDESLSLARRSVELAEQSVQRSEQSLKHQVEMIRLLGELVACQKR